MCELASVELHRVRVPLEERYHLSFGAVDAFESLFVEVETDDGRRGLGEATPLAGYSDETFSESWSAGADAGPDLVGLEPEPALERLSGHFDGLPFTRSAFDCAIRTARTEGVPPVEAPIVGVTSTDVPSESAIDAIEAYTSEGIEAVKVKIGFDPERDASRLRDIADAAPDRLSFRVDANQGYSPEEARTFLDAAPVDRLQLLEQPLPVGSLEEHARLKETYPVTVMLDEEIRTTDDLTAAADENAAGAVKLKLMKAGGWERLRRAVAEARRLGFEVVVGNGVQTEIGCVHEALVWSETGLELAGEFNGWRKQSAPIGERGPTFGDGRLRWDAGELRLDETALERFGRDTLRFASPSRRR